MDQFPLDQRPPFERSLWLLLDLLDLQTMPGWRLLDHEHAVAACVDSLRISLGGVRHTLTTQQSSQLLLELAIQAIHGYGNGGVLIAYALDFGRGRRRDFEYGEGLGLATWIADVLVETLRTDAWRHRPVWQQVIATMEGAVERVDMMSTSIQSWEFVIDQPVTEVMLMELIDHVRTIAPPLALTSELDAFLRREVVAVLAASSAPWRSQRPLVMAAFQVVREQLTGVQAALKAGLAHHEAQWMAGTAPRCYASLTWREHRR